MASSILLCASCTVQALHSGQGDLLTSVTVTRYWWFVPFYDQDGWTVRGDVVRTR